MVKVTGPGAGYANVEVRVSDQPPTDGVWYAPDGGEVRVTVDGKIYSSGESVAFVIGIQLGTPIGVLWIGEASQYGSDIHEYAILNVTQLVNLLMQTIGISSIDLRAMVVGATSVGEAMSAWDVDAATSLGVIKEEEPPGGGDPVGDAFIDGTISATICGYAPVDGAWIIAPGTDQVTAKVSGSITAFGGEGPVTGGILIGCNGKPLTTVYHGAVSRDYEVSFENEFAFYLSDFGFKDKPIALSWQPIVAPTPGDVFAAFDPELQRTIGMIVPEGYVPPENGGNGQEPIPTVIRRWATEKPQELFLGVAAVMVSVLLIMGRRK